MDVKIKICGITDLADARYCAGAGADYLGFIQYEQSPRYIEPDLARQMIEWIYGPEAVGVYVNATADAINASAEAIGFDLVQLHGDEPPALCAAVAPPVIKAIHVGEDDDADTLRRRMEPYADHVAFFLLDTKLSGLWGGTGQTFDWKHARAVARDYPLFLAGGLTAENAEEAARTVHPYGLDLSSSLEASPGRKDFEAVDRFFEAIQRLS